jgi:heparinase II/III-like protein
MNRIGNLNLPMSDKLLAENNFFELYPFDGGGSFINSEIQGSVDDKTIAENILNGALDDFGILPGLDFAKFERWRSIEKSCWLNRCYFIVPLAKYYSNSNDEDIATLVKDTILFFFRNYHAPQSPIEIKKHLDFVYDIRDNNYNQNTYEENQQDETDVKYIWFDFQPASRIIHFLYALHFIKDSSSLLDSEFHEIICGIEAHAKLIAISESRYEELESPGNHQSLRGLALLYAGALLENDFFLNEGIRICKFHIENDFFGDGVLKEISPSYHVFETWHVRDAYILSKKYAFTVSDQHEEVLRKAAQFIISIQQPDGYSIVLDDGYELKLFAFLNSLPPEIVKDSMINSRGKLYYPDAQLAFYSDEIQYICLDASPKLGLFSHYHAGKNAITYFYDKIPVLIDSGCCSYDDPAFPGYKHAESHSSLLINSKGDGVFEGLYHCPHYASAKSMGWQGNEITSVIKSPVPEWGNIAWSRTLKVESSDFRIIDNIQNNSNIEKEFTFIFNLHPAVNIRTISVDQVVLKIQNCEFVLTFNTSQNIEIIEAKGRCFLNSNHYDNLQLHIKILTQCNISMDTRFGAVSF